MNERIKKLSEQSGITDNNLSDGNMSLTDLEKFAQLIIKEVTDLLDQEQWDQGQDWTCKNGDRIIEKIEEHFGVEQ